MGCKRWPDDPAHGGPPGRTCPTCKTEDQRKKTNERRVNGKCTYTTSCPNPTGGKSICDVHRRKSQANRKARASARPLPPQINQVPTLNPTPTPPSTQILTNHRSTTPWQRVAWAIYPDESPFADTYLLSIEVFPDDHRLFSKESWLEHALDSGLGECALVPVEDGGYRIHQGLVTIAIASALSEQFTVVPLDWTQFSDQLRKGLLNAECCDSNGRAQSTIVFLHASSQYPRNVTLEEAYSEIETLKYLHGAAIRAYPSESETRAEWLKLPDIRALDEIALSSDPKGPWSYRPTTCFGLGPCQLENNDFTIHKRTHSEGGNHVKFQPASHRANLTCTSSHLPAPSSTTRSRSKSAKTSFSRRGSSPTRIVLQSRWFHQSVVPRLRKWEFRVFIVTERSTSATATRGLTGTIVKVVKTTVSRTGEIGAREVTNNDFGGDLTGDLGRRELEEFALYVFERLRSRSDWLEKFESLEVGVRMDVGVAEVQDDRNEPDYEVDDTPEPASYPSIAPRSTDSTPQPPQLPGQCFRYFVNEATRWYEAHFFSHNVCAEPKTQICAAFGAAFTRYVENEMIDV